MVVRKLHAIEICLLTRDPNHTDQMSADAVYSPLWMNLLTVHDLFEDNNNFCLNGALRVVLLNNFGHDGLQFATHLHLCIPLFLPQ